MSGQAADGPEGWEANLRLSPVEDSKASAPDMLVPKQSLVMTATVWMPEKINWFPQFPQWDMKDATVIPMFMLSPSIERPHGHFNQRGATQNYLLTPLAEGNLSLSPTAITVFPDQDNSPVLPLSPIHLKVALPAGANDIDRFFPASSVQLRQSWYLLNADNQREALDSHALNHLRLQHGQLLERRILIEAHGLRGSLIPALIPPSQVLQHEAESNDLTNYDEFIGGMRTEHWYYGPDPSGQIATGTIATRWYDTAHKTFKNTSLSGLTVKSEITKPVSAALSLTVWDKLVLLPDWLYLTTGCAMIILALILIYRQTLLRFLVTIIKRGKRATAHNAALQRAKVCFLIALSGPQNPRTQWAYQRWLFSVKTEHHEPECKHIQQWFAAAYRENETPFPSRWWIIRDVFQDPHKKTTKKVSRYAKTLPELF